MKWMNSILFVLLKSDSSINWIEFIKEDQHMWKRDERNEYKREEERGANDC
jgi:hypothetical protein